MNASKIRKILDVHVPFGPGYPFSVLLEAWADRVCFYQDLSDTGANPREWTVHDLIGDLFLRDAIHVAATTGGIEEGAGADAGGLALLNAPDRIYRRLIVDDTDGTIHRAVGDDMSEAEWASRAWWWRGIPPLLDAE